MSSGKKNGGPGELSRAAASMVAGIIIGIGRVIESIFRLVFRILSSF